MRYRENHTMAAAEQAHAVDAASRPRDRGFFETENRPEGSTDLLVAAQLMGRPFGTRGKAASMPFLAVDAANRAS